MNMITSILKRIRKVWRLLNRGNKWEEVLVVSSKKPEPLLRRYSYLRSKGIRCKLYNLNSPSGRGVYAGMMSLRVNVEDMPKARSLLREFRD